MHDTKVHTFIFELWSDAFIWNVTTTSVDCDVVLCCSNQLFSFRRHKLVFKPDIVVIETEKLVRKVLTVQEIRLVWASKGLIVHPLDRRYSRISG